MSIFTDRDGQPDVGNVVVFMVGVTAVVAVVNLSLLAALQLWLSADHHVDLQALGMGIGAVLTGCATLVGAYAGYWFADGSNKRAQAAAQSGG